MIDLRDRGVATHAGEVAEDLFLELLLTHSDGQPGSLPRFDEFAAEAGRPHDCAVIREYAPALLPALAERGLIHLELPRYGGFDNWSFSLLPPGRAAAQTARERRANTAERRVTARLTLLRWLYRQNEETSDPGRFQKISQFFASPLSCVWGMPFEVADIDHAGAWLADKGLIEAELAGFDAALFAARITPAGRDCMEDYDGDIAEYRRSKKMSTGGVYIGRDNFGNAAWAGGDVRQSQEKVDVQTLMPTLDGIRATANSLGLSESDTQMLRGEIDRIEEQGKAGELDPPTAKKRLEKVKELLGKASHALVPALTAGVKHLIDNLTQ